ncbi:MAG TPA: triple tyrosine motif-containing protein [Pricia sp.]|nr:triple tyrosine motif-containing protein [Pricia sp.]
MKRYLFYFLALLCWDSFSQQLPPIQNYTPKEYYGEYQNWGISQSVSKNIYVANHTRLLEFDGEKWHRYQLPTPSIIRSVEAVGDRIYTGSYGEFGYWKKDGSGELGYTSLSEKLTSSLSDDEEFWDILVLENWVLFQSLDRIYIYDNLEDNFKIIDASSKKAKLHLVKDRVFFQKAKKGLFTIENGKSILVSDAPILKNQSIIGIYEWRKGLLIITEDARFYEFDFKTLQPRPTALDNSNINLYSSIRLDDGSLILGSIANGFYQISPNGDLVLHMNQAKGMNNNTVLSLFQDTDRNLWLGLDNGIGIINLYSPFNEYADKLGNLGLVYAAIRHNGYFYLGTNQGLFAKKMDTADEFKLIKGTEGQVWSLQLVHSTLFCGHNGGTFTVTGATAELVSEFPGTWGVKPLKHSDNLILQGNYNGLSLLEKAKGSWALRNTVKGFTISSRFFITDSLNVLVDHEQKGLYFIQLDQDLRRVVKITNEPPLGHGSNIFRFKDRTYYKTHEGIYTFKGASKEPVRDTALTQMIFEGHDDPISIIIPDTTAQKLWFFTDTAIKYITQNDISGKLRKTGIPIPNTLRSNLGVSGFENISRIAENEYLIGSSNGYVSLDLDKVKSTDHKVRINTIYGGNYSDTPAKIVLDTTGTFSFSKNNLKFEFSVPEFHKYKETRYQYRLIGLYGDWSDWSEMAEASFSNLSFGEYQFQVRAMVGNNITENVASYLFVIQRPWYLSNLAILFYVVGLAFLFYAVHRLYKRYYRKKQVSLIRRNEKELERRNLAEKERIAQLSNEKLQSEIENKNRELAISTMSILKKNKFLYSIKSSLNDISPKEKPIRSVIKKIDQNINSEDDWKFFEDAFNNADKDFLRQIKSRHESLTNNDLRLCAYLRLNLSSKEIAPLLNISVKSVEMKRYRLRKKFDLPHQDNLVDYILNF